MPFFPYTLGNRIVFFLGPTTRSVLWPKMCRKCDSGRGSAPDPAGGAHDAPPDPVVGWGAETPPHTQPHSVPRCSRLRCLDRRAPWHQILATPLVTTTFWGKVAPVGYLIQFQISDWTKLSKRKLAEHLIEPVMSNLSRKISTTGPNGRLYILSHSAVL